MLNRHAVREIIIALPDQIPDLYGLHQCVWDHALRAARPGVRPAFLYRVEQGIIHVRSADFVRGIIKELRPGPYLLDIAAIVQGHDGEHPVALSDLPAWAREKIARAGFHIKHLELVDFGTQHGQKRDRFSSRRHWIHIPTAKLRLDLDICQHDQAQNAWRCGLGRGRRFGLGMLHPA